MLPDFLQKRRRSLNLTALNPSLANVGVAVCETLMPRYLDKAGVSCERMQHAGLPLEFITLLLSAVFGAQDEGELRRVFELFDASGDGCLDEEEFLAMVPMLGEDVPPEWLGKLFEVIDGDGNSVVTYDEFVKFVRLCNPRGDNDGAPLAADEASGWRALVKGDDHDEKVVLQVARRRSGGAKAGWRSVAMGDLKHLERLGALPIARVDNENAEAVVDRLREMRMPDHQVLAIVRAVFVTQTDEDYAKVFDIFDTDSTGGIDQGEFHQIAALLGERTTLQELRELFIAADRDCNGLLDVDEFSALLRTLSPKMKDKAEAQGARLLVARERLQQRVGEVFGEGRASDEPPTATCKAIVLGDAPPSELFREAQQAVVAHLAALCLEVEKAATPKAAQASQMRRGSAVFHAKQNGHDNVVSMVEAMASQFGDAPAQSTDSVSQSASASVRDVSSI